MVLGRNVGLGFVVVVGGVPGCLAGGDDGVDVGTVLEWLVGTDGDVEGNKDATT